MNNINWKAKIGSRKFWALLCAFITSICVLMNVSAGEVEKIVALITSFGSIVMYMYTEGEIDKERVKSDKIDK